VLVRRSTDISEILTARMVHAQVTAATEAEARKELKGTPLSQLGAPTQQLRYTGSYGDTSYVVKAPEGDPATVYAHNSIWPRKVDPKMPYVRARHLNTRHLLPSTRSRSWPVPVRFPLLAAPPRSKWCTRMGRRTCNR